MRSGGDPVTERKRDAAATREAILEAATRRFATQGYERAGVREIAADAGVTAALVNRYFGSKEELFAEVIGTASTSGTSDGGRANLAEHLARVDGVRAGGPAGPGADTVAAPAAFRRGTPARLDLFRTRPRPQRPTAPRRATRRRRRRGPGRHGHRPAHGVRDHAPGAPPRGFRGRPAEELVALLSKSLAACIG